MRPKTILLGISGPSSSGKTTLSRLVRTILPSSFILHLDDFYLTDAEIPIRNGVQDWDCIESLDLTTFEDSLRYIKEHGQSPPDLVSKEDQNAVGESGVSAEAVEQWKSVVRENEQWQKLLGLNISLTGSGEVRVAIIDGFLLYAESMRTIRELFDVKLFLPTTKALTKRRREARQGYVTIEGFWEDPPGYVDDIVWPNYVRDHEFLFRNGLVEEEVDEAVCEKVHICAMPREYAEDMDGALTWTMNTLKDALSSQT
ncbi:P-loop containing nucleoside triphosphate hydrolase protein [Pseudovirgaria hyperparasitica]|uniref:P-loop containing nucleoside triphosphate hydrolase protein n=1 Tax=Pseudovirgaria hyperparasitica TaxID=470096 RepID=A0A6A6WK30_9PEZI|nr:P-loop containing nucleoside triphosphate hydrolase protein [Pseudovirgaria hyperparasitica]KAF2762181.1 P-loop containing nucleoside triphosphate hydrolase protein [Pseudovirgaria hyperparasitica]